MMYHVRQSWLALRANFTAGVATLTTMTLTLTLLALVGMVTLNLEQIVRGLERDVQITAFLKPTANAAAGSAQSESVLKTLNTLEGLSSAVFISRDEAYKRLTEDYAALGDAQKLVQNPLQDRIVVKVTQPTKLEETAAAMRKIDGVTDLEYGASFVTTVLSALSTVRIAGYVLVGLLLLNTLLNILNTIRVAMFARRDEIQVMRMIGATRGFIRMPYILEGVGLALLSSLVTLGLVLPGYNALAERVAALVPYVPVIQDVGVVLRVLAVVTGLGVLLGFVGSLFATNRYLREAE
jgi:cell division transport system permease protein